MLFKEITMTADEYMKEASRTEDGNYSFKGVAGCTPRIEHAALGLVTEAAEIMSVVKRAKIYGKEIDTVNLIEEAGDIMWYLALLADELGVDFSTIWDKNIRKLRERYPEKWTRDAALNRNHKKEREILES